jgi:hypothetical protein
MAEHRAPDRLFTSRVPVHSVLVQKSVTTITNAVGRLSMLDARQSWRDSQDAGGKKSEKDGNRVASRKRR